MNVRLLRGIQEMEEWVIIQTNVVTKSVIIPDSLDVAYPKHVKKLNPNSVTKNSSLTNASAIKKPLFVIHGKNDPRVPLNEAE